MEDSKQCISCLVINVKMYDLFEPAIFKAYTDLTGISNFGPSKNICFQCCAILRRCEKFKNQCYKANNVLLNQLHILGSNNVRKQGLSPLVQANVFNFECKSESEHIFNHDEIKVEVMLKEEQYDQDYAERNGIINWTLFEHEAVEGIQVENIKYADNIDVELEEPVKSKSATKKKTSKKKKEIKLAKVESDSDYHDNDYNYNNDMDYNPTDSDDEVIGNLVSKRKAAAAKAVPKKKSKKEPKKTARQTKIEEIIDNEKTENENDETDEPKPKRKGKKRNEDMSFFEGYATVINLSLEDALKEMELRKESSNYKNNQYKCHLCFRAYDLKGPYDNHMKYHEPKPGEYECEICHRWFRKSFHLCKHMFITHKKKFVCQLCPYVCYCISQARRHVELHKGKVYPCELCGQTFKQQNTLIMHRRAKHLASESVCQHCGGSFSGDQGLRAHKGLVHKDEPEDFTGPMCDECNLQFATEKALKRHLVLSPKHKISNGCEICGETFATAVILKKHLRTHARKMKAKAVPSECSVCKKPILNLNDYESHMTSAHPDSAEAKKIDRASVCEVCGKRFKKKCFLVYHQRQHTNERPFQCDVCWKWFRLMGQLVMHKATHADDRDRTRYKCEMCEKEFICKNALKKHINRTHLGIRPHKCSVCGKSFPTPCEVKYHTEYVHLKKPWPKRDRSRQSKAFVDDKYTGIPGIVP